MSEKFVDELIQINQMHEGKSCINELKNRFDIL